MSGSLKGSDPVSPCSPSSPNPASPPDNLAPVDLAKALSDLQNTSVRILPILLKLSLHIYNIITVSFSANFF